MIEVRRVTPIMSSKYKEVFLAIDLGPSDNGKLRRLEFLNLHLEGDSPEILAQSYHDVLKELQTHAEEVCKALVKVKDKETSAHHPTQVVKKLVKKLPRRPA